MPVFNFGEDIIQNLKDAGCNNDIISRFINYSDKGKVNEELRLLYEHRSSLLNKLHEIQKNISCLDYLVYQINKTK